MSTLDQLAPAAAALSQVGGSFAWLDAGPGAVTGASYLVLPADDEHRFTANVRTGCVTERVGGQLAVSHGDIFSALRAHWQPQRGSGAHAVFTGGWVGWFGYECAQATLHLPLVTEGSDYPDAAWFAAGAWVKLDHATGALRIDGSDASAVERLHDALRANRMPARQPRGVDNPGWRDTPGHYATQVRAAQALITAGENYQLCFTSRVSGAEQLDAFAVYSRLRAAAPSHHGSFICIGETAIASASPEQFLQLSPDGQLSTKPIKGTRRRDPDPVADRLLAEELHASDKERAENIMIVDLMRNDLGRVAVTGSVQVPSLLAVESYPPVHQLVSTVRAHLESHRHPMDAIEASFPAGSMTGTPKHRAVAHLQELESGPRGIYSGAHGYLSNDGSLDLAMTIRTIVMRPDGWSIGAGGGITALSEPDAEVAEAQLKAAALLAVLRGSDAD